MLVGGYQRLFSFSPIKIPIFALTISLLDALILYFFGNYEIRIGREINAKSLIAMGKENRTHVISSSVVFLGILAGYYKVPYIEGIITIGISFLIFTIGLNALKGSIFALMDVSPSRKVEEKVVKAMESVPGIE